MEEKKKAGTGAKPGRKPMTEKQKAAAEKKRAEAKAKALAMKPVVYVQYQDSEAEIDALVEAAKADFKANRKRAPLVTDLKLYIKPEERAAYYVINDNENYTGKIAY